MKEIMQFQHRSDDFFESSSNESMLSDFNPASKITEAKSKILSSEEYLKTDFAHSEKSMYEYQLEKGRKALAYFGTSHSNDPKDEIFKKMKERFDSFKPDMVLIEGCEPVNNVEYASYFFKKYSSLNADDVIVQGGEPWYMIHLVSNARTQGENVDIFSPELDDNKELLLLKEKSFSENDIADYYTYRQMGQELRETSTESQAIEKMQEFISRMKKVFSELGWNTAQFDTLQDSFTEGNIKDEKYYINLTSPMVSEQDALPTNKISMALNNVRNEYQLEAIADAFNTHSRVLVVYGHGHAVVLEPALRELFA